MRDSWGTVAAWVALGASLVNGAIVFGELRGQVDRNTKDIAQVQAERRDNAATLAEIKDTVTVVRTKLEILLPTAPMEARR